MSARDSESGSSTYKGGSGRAGGLGNGGIGGGMGGGGNYGGGMGGGAGRNGGIGNQTGLTTGNRMLGGVAKGRPGGLAANRGAWGLPDLPQVAQHPLARPAAPRVPGLLDNPPAVAPAPVIEDVPLPTPQVPPSIPPNALMYPFEGPNFTNTWRTVGSTFYKNNLGNPYPQYQPAPTSAPGKEDFQGQQPAVAAGKGDYLGGNFGYSGAWRR